MTWPNVLVEPEQVGRVVPGLECNQAGELLVAQGVPDAVDLVCESRYQGVGRRRMHARLPGWG